MILYDSYVYSYIVLVVTIHWFLPWTSPRIQCSIPKGIVLIRNDHWIFGFNAWTYAFQRQLAVRTMSNPMSTGWSAAVCFSLFQVEYTHYTHIGCGSNLLKPYLGCLANIHDQNKWFCGPAIGSAPRGPSFPPSYPIAVASTAQNPHRYAASAWHRAPAFGRRIASARDNIRTFGNQRWPRNQL